MNLALRQLSRRFEFDSGRITLTTQITQTTHCTQ